MPTILEIDAPNRWDAARLFDRLARFRPHLVAFGPAGGRWLVRARTPGDGGGGLTTALRIVEEWQAERGISSVGVCVVGGRLTRDDLDDLPGGRSATRRQLRFRHERPHEIARR